MDEVSLNREHPLLPTSRVLPPSRVKRYLDVFRRAWRDFDDDQAQSLGAALAYYIVLSIAPLLLIAIAVAGVVFGREAAQGAIERQLASTLGENVARALNEMILMASRPQSGAMATIAGVVTLLFGVAGVFGQLQDALDKIWNVERPPAGWKTMIRERFLSMTMVFGIGLLLLVTLVFDTAISAMGKYASQHFPGGETVLLQIVQLVISFGIITVLFALIFRYLPHTHVAWRDVWSGAAVTSFLFVIGKFLLGLYIGRAAVGSAYGAAGSLVVILIWVYWSAQILFFGAEFTQVYARSHGSRAGEAKSVKKLIT
ncbi:MAG: YihY/virulence factor BrkB family protein [Thermoanaerobaculia bacterium]